MSAFDQDVVHSYRPSRVRVEQSVAAIYRVDGHIRRSTGKTRDISMTGIFFYADFSPAVGSSVQLMLTFPAEITYDEPLSALCKGTVVRVERNSPAREFGVAVEIGYYEPVVGAGGTASG